MRISVITPSIRPRGLEVTFNTLQNQTLKDFEWLPRLSIPGEKSDLCYQTNQALKESKGELLVFLQDYIVIEPDALQRMWDRYQESPKTGWTAPVGKAANDFITEGVVGSVDYDWRAYWPADKDMESHRFEIDWACTPRSAVDYVGYFDEDFDRGFGWENVDWAYRLAKKGWTFRCDPDNKAFAFDHDKFFPHPYKKNPNSDLWAVKKAIHDME